ncbi:MAG TPA: group 1 truncated hemoglobin [Parafilimonas sp.]|nr:group 1 truncated hemoglobin [Parafilimonas sp.]
MANTDTIDQKPSLYERLGGEPGLRKIVNDILDRNLNNPLIGRHFQNTDMERLKQLVFDFFSMGTGGPHKYTGKDMRSAHAGLNISEQDFLIGNDDVLRALEENGIAEADRNEVIGILNSMKEDVIRK